MRPPLSLLTAACLLMHALLGCCLHHAHGSEGAESTFCAQEGHGEGHDACDHSHKGDDKCGVGRCVFVLPAKAWAGDCSDRLLQPAYAALVSDQGYAPIASPGARVAPLHGLGLSLPLHLMHQVLLI